eukprot:456879_1
MSTSASKPNKKHHETSELELIIWFYVRNYYEDKFNTIKYLILQFSKRVIDSKLLTNKEDMNFVELLSLKISNIKHFKLLFRASEHKYLASKFH